MSEWMNLIDLRSGAIFETKDGIIAVKTEYFYSDYNPQPQCVLLASGEYAHFSKKDMEQVREIKTTDRALTTIEQLNNTFSQLPDSQIDIRLCLSSTSTEGNQVDYVAEGTDEWGNVSHIVSGITDTPINALEVITEVLVMRKRS